MAHQTVVELPLRLPAAGLATDRDLHTGRCAHADNLHHHHHNLHNLHHHHLHHLPHYHPASNGMKSFAMNGHRNGEPPRAVAAAAAIPPNPNPVCSSSTSLPGPAPAVAPAAVSSSSSSSAAAAAAATAAAAYKKQHKHSRSSYSEGSPLSSRNNSLTFRPPKRQMPSPDKTIAIINASGRQAASVIRVATAVGYRVRAQMRSLEGFISTEVATNPNVEVIVGELYTREPPPPPPPQQQQQQRQRQDFANPPNLQTHLTGGSDRASDSASDGASDRASDSASDREDVTRKGPVPVAGVGVNHALITELFRGTQLAFINTTFYGDEIRIGKALLDAARDAGIQHYVYSSMPDHSAYDPAWPSLPLWAAKHEVEDYVRASGVPATFVYTGIYNNNFTSLMYPLFCMELQEADGSFVWQAPFHPDAKLPWLDAEHDMGPAVLQIFKDGPAKWGGRRIALAYEMLTPAEACAEFARGLGRPVRYVRGPIEIKVKIPAGYRQQLEALQTLFALGGNDPAAQPPYFGDAELEASCPGAAMVLWEGPRLLEEYAREVFPVEEHANGLRWMLDGADEEEEAESSEIDDDPPAGGEVDDGEDADEGLEMKARKRVEEKWLA